MRNQYCMIKTFGFTTIFALSLGFAHIVEAQMAADKCKFVGNVISGSVPASFDTYWNQVTPENGGKWGSVEGTRDVMQWGGIRTAYNKAKSKGYSFRQHTFIWGNQFPGWIADLSQEEQLEEITEWIRLYGEEFPDTDFIDVVNEPLNDPPINGSGNFIDALGGAGDTDYDWVIKAFELAREYCPNAKLHINEYNILNSVNNTNRYKNLVMLLKERNLIDGIGVQAHGLETMTGAALRSNLDILASTGLPIYVTEYDVDIADNNLQLQKLQEQFPVFWKHRGVDGITLWGYIQGAIWKTNAYLVGSTGLERPALTWLKTYISQNEPVCYRDVTSVDQPDEELLSVYPNPATGGHFTFVFEKPMQSLRISDIKGREVASIDVKGKSSIQTEINETPGVYILHISGPSGSVYKKLLVK